MKSQSILKMNSISFSYDDSFSLNTINLEFKSGTIYSLLGKNGSGKTTLFKLLLNFIKPCEGSISIDNSNYDSICNLSKQIAYVPQINSLNSDLSVFDFILLGRNPYINYFQTPRKIDVKKTYEVIEYTNLSNIKLKPLNTLSGGQMQLVSIARALNQDTDFIVLDEPSSSLDIDHQHSIFSLLSHMSYSENKCIIFSTHDPSIALKYSDESILLKKGHVLINGPSNSILTKNNLSKIYTSFSDNNSIALTTGTF
jgi:iron complex transport system ATP-binding protein